MLYCYRDKNFNGVGPVLNKKAKVISSQFDETHRDKSVQEIKQFVARLPHMLATKQSLAKRKTCVYIIFAHLYKSNFQYIFFWHMYFCGLFKWFYFYYIYLLL